MTNNTQLVCFKKLCYGAQFKYSADDAAVWVKIGHNTVAGWDPKYVSDSWIGQPICAFAEDDQLDAEVFLVTPAPAEDVRAVVEEPVISSAGDAWLWHELRAKYGDGSGQEEGFYAGWADCLRSRS